MSLPVLAVLVFVLSARASTNLRLGTERELVAQADRGTDIDEWLSERHEDLDVLSRLVNERLTDANLTQILVHTKSAADDYELLEVADPSGRLRVSSGSGQQLDVSGQAWFDRTSSGQSTTSPVYEQNGVLHFVVAQPVQDPSGTVTAVVLADINVPALLTFLDADYAHTGRILVVDGQGRLLLSSDMTGAEDDAALLSRGALAQAPGDVRGLAGRTRPGVRTLTEGGRSVFAAYQPGPQGLGWVIVAEENSSEALALATDLRHLGILLLVGGVALQIGLAALFSVQEVRRMRRLVAGSRSASAGVSTRSSDLSASSEELAATTTEQSAAVTETSATMEELARTSASIADTVDQIAAQAQDTRESLEVAKVDIQASSERTLALTQRVNEVGGILELINQIADQTNLLALNAAIESARAGEAGRGFAVVADEVRRLAESSKSSAEDIGRIIEATRDETNATVMAMEKGAKQMQRGLELLEQVAEATAQISMTTQQQRSATEQVVETMEQLASANRQLSEAAQEIASAAGELSGLASGLESDAAAAASQF
ncbi:MAG: methyl-accepting chemotaxis protein [Actinomycetota bacterium]